MNEKVRLAFPRVNPNVFRVTHEFMLFFRQAVVLYPAKSKNLYFDGAHARESMNSKKEKSVGNKRGPYAQYVA